MEADRIPVIIGAGEVTERPADLLQAHEPAALMAEALQRAAEDAGAPDLLPALDSLDIVNSVSWPYGDLPSALAGFLGFRPRRLVYGPVGGESPVRHLHEAANRIARGESAVAAVVGAEATHAVAQAQKQGVTLPWTPPDPNWTRTRGRDFLHPLSVRLGVADPVSVYPFYENAVEAFLGQTPAEGQAESAALWSRFSAVAARNPAAWLKREYSPDEIGTPGPANRPIAYPYTKLQVANPMVNQGGAILLTSLARARAAGVPEERMVHLWGGAAAVEPRDYLNRDHYHESHAQNAVLDACARIAEDEGAAFETCELYSCFPCVPKMAARRLGLPRGMAPTTTGGLTFFGAPLNNYMTHAAAAMTRALREKPGSAALLYGQGEFVTKHHAVVLASRPPASWRLPQDYSVQAEADGRRGPVPEFAEAAEGAATVETFTVLHDRDGAPHHGVVILRTADGRRTLGRVPGTEAGTIALLKRPDRTPIGMPGVLRRAADGLQDWSPA
ncbi:acetyl-CoA acetyltransferase [Paracraurococcus lichenis]|uniref:Acetyl-CoA acetyltransferase n=1 Tax=Paracraurococcus lichenis TaxID=3064888 RepID=A0ABT9DSM3_9PROT|nr:acetyl-CoA acetyltransferase [Paracraurococcus sp. LOR1-02]MDO9706897.1 acetyl-CoA acetyltransferase [Paracraurococcus sp. LOR1-02]